MSFIISRISSVVVNAQKSYQRFIDACIENSVRNMLYFRGLLIAGGVSMLTGLIIHVVHGDDITLRYLGVMFLTSFMLSFLVISIAFLTKRYWPVIAALYLFILAYSVFIISYFVDMKPNQSLWEVIWFVKWLFVGPLLILGSSSFAFYKYCVVMGLPLPESRGWRIRSRE